MGMWPNVHPLFVHFPIALLLVALLLDGVAIIGRRERWRACSGAVLVLAALGAIAAAVSGWVAEEIVEPAVNGIGQGELLEDHRTAALIMMGLAVVLAAWRRLLKMEHPRGGWRWLYLGLLLAAAIMLATAADLGGQLVYGHGIGTAVSPPAAVGK